MNRPRVSVVRYLNTVPLVWGMLEGQQRGKYDLEFTTPAGCADAVRARQADVGIIPSIEYQRMDQVEIIPGLSIASKASVKSVMLFSSKPIEQIRKVAMDNSSRTSIALLTILLRKFYQQDFDSIPADPDPGKMLEQADAALVIGDPALTYQGAAARVYDLAMEWRRFTGLPFVFAPWVGHSQAGLAHLRHDFEDSCSYGLTHMDEIAGVYAPRYNLAPGQVKAYLTENIDYTLDEENLKGLSLFYKLAQESGLISRQKDLRFAEPVRGVVSS
jgi:chorismate dehydratase